METGHGVHLVDIEGEKVGQRHLFEQADDKQRQAVGNVPTGDGPGRPQLRQQVPCPLDGPRHQLREKRDERGVADEAGLLLHLPAVEVDGVAHRLEHEERDADRKQDVRLGDRNREPGSGKKGVQVPGDEGPVLEEPQQAQVVDDREGKEELASPRTCHGEDGEVVDGRGVEDEEQVQPVPPPVEHVRGDQQPEVPEARSAGQQMDGVYDREEAGEDPVVKQHGIDLCRATSGVGNRWVRRCRVRGGSERRQAPNTGSNM